MVMSGWTVTISLIVVALAAIYRFITYRQSFFERLGIPHVKPTFLVGNQGPVLFGIRSFMDQVKLIYNKIPEAKYFGFYMFLQPIIMMKDPEIIKEVTVKYFDNFTDHSSFAIDELDPLFSRNLFGLRGQKWREYR